jgi:outer membrane protein OmpA-like peptidoglycan-associated protein
MTKNGIILSIILTITNLSPALAGYLTSSELSKPESKWTSFNNKKFKLCKIKNEKRKPKKITKKIKVHFENDLYEISEKEQNKILKAFKKYFHKKVKHIEIDGHADVLGDSDYNLKLSNQRLNAVISFINQEKLITHHLNAKTQYFGKSKSTKHQRKDRFVEIRFIEVRPTTDNIKRIYLVDGSYSMKKRRTITGYTFDDLRAMNIPKDTVVYIVRDNLVGCDGEDIRNYIPEGRTYIREAMGLFAYHMRGKIRFFTFSDGIEPLGENEEKVIDQYISESKKVHKIKWYFK